MTHSIVLPEAPPIDDPHHWYRLISDIRLFLARADRRASNSSNVNRLIDEYAFGTAVTTIQVNPQVMNPILLSSLIAVSSAAAGTITIGMRQIPIPQGTTCLNGLAMQLRPKEYPLTLTTTIAGSLYLEIMGEEWAVASQ